MNWPPKFSLDSEQILNLLTGDRFYSAADAALREAVLNAIDACGRRSDIEEKFEQTIEIIFDTQASTVTIIDNGDGMDRDDLVRLFAKVGASASKLSQTTSEVQYQAIGEFGIGVISYFLVCDSFHIHTCKPGETTIALEFGRTMFDAETPAKEIPARNRSGGTELILYLNNPELIHLLIQKYPHWVRSVKGMSAIQLPGNENIPQGGLTKQILPIDIDTPSWVIKAELGPPTMFNVWTALDGRAHVDLLYHGVFVQRLDVQGLWAIEGSLHVDPKHFKPNLNRESFIGNEVIQEITRFLQSIHPLILHAALEIVRTHLSEKNISSWGINKWVTLWLAVPRGAEYSDVAKEWDEEFWKHKTFRLLLIKDKEVSLAELYGHNYEELYIAPINLRKNHIVNAAVRVLRAKGIPVIQGIVRDNGYLSLSSLSKNSSSESVLEYFRDKFPNLVRVENKAQDILTRESTEAEMFAGPPMVRIVHLGQDAAPLVRANKEIWINIDSSAGKEVVRETCHRNEGYIGLLVACQIHAPAHIGEIANVLSKLKEQQPPLGPVRRQFLRRLAK